MKNRRLNVLFIAVIALAAAPQALQDARQWANAAQDRAETEFWSIFLSYQTPAPEGARAKGSTELVAVRGGAQTGDKCPFKRIVMPAGETRDSEGVKAAAPSKAAKETRGARLTPGAAGPGQVERDFDNEAVASAAQPVRVFRFSEGEKSALRASALHGRETERMTDVAMKPDIASSFPRYENIQIKVRQVMELDRPMRRKARDSRERSEPSDDLPVANPVGSM
jgi:hypothetical protein